MKFWAVILLLVIAGCKIRSKKKPFTTTTPQSTSAGYVIDTVIIGGDTLLLKRWIDRDCPEYQRSRQEVRLDARADRQENRLRTSVIKQENKYDFKLEIKTLKGLIKNYSDSLDAMVKVSRIEKNKSIKLNKSNNVLQNKLDKREKKCMPKWKFWLYIIFWGVVFFVLGVLLARPIKKILVRIIPALNILNLK